MAAQIRLDRSRYFSEVRGERTANDPHADVHFQQDGLPFDAEGNLVDESEENSPARHKVLNPDGSLAYWRDPLWNDEMRMRRDAKLRRLERRGEVVQSGDVDFSAWLRGEIEYDQKLLFREAKKKFGRVFARLEDLVEDLVYSRGILPEKEVAESRMRLLDGAAA
jgi:hypothetical protein